MPTGNHSPIAVQERATSKQSTPFTFLADANWKKIADTIQQEGPPLEPRQKVAKVPQHTNLADALDAVEENLKREVIMGDAERIASTLWIAQTYVHKHYKLAPILFITSAGFGSAKSTLLSLIADMSCGGRIYNKATAAALGRAKKKFGSDLTIALDQLDNALDLRASETGGMLDRLISGADRNSKQLVAEKGSAGAFDLVEHDLSYPLALAKIGELPNQALRSRCILIQMHPATPAEAAQLSDRARELADKDIRPTLTTIMEQLAPEIAASKPTIPPKLFNRGADKWRPLLAIAEAAGGDWPARALAAIDELETEEEEELPAHKALLCKVIAVTKDWPDEVVFSTELDAELDKIGDKVRSSKRRAKLLRLVGLKPERHWRGTKQLRGYLVADIRSAAERYIKQDTCDA